MSHVVATIVCLATGLAQPPSAVLPLLSDGQESRVTYFQQGLMGKIAAKRHISLPAGYAGYVSRPDCTRLGSTVWLSIGKGPARKYRQVDCSQERDLKRQRAVNLTEVDWAVAHAEGFVSEGHATGHVWIVEAK